MDFPSIVLLTDFGTRDGFVGVMKGVINSLLHKPVPLIDLSHEVAPQELAQGAWILQSALPYFGPRTVWLTVVDPGVGTTDQQSLLCWWPPKRQIFIGPDNGLLSPVYAQAGADLQVYDLRNSAFYAETAATRSRTFHGRDLYAPMAAKAANALLADAVPDFLSGLGAPVTPRHILAAEPPNRERANQGWRIRGRIAHTDRFGNLITDIPAGWAPVGRELTLLRPQADPLTLPVVGAYAEARAGGPVAVPSSGGTLELAVFGGHAASHLGMKTGDLILLQMS